MGQKVNPYGFRLGYTKDWRSIWYAEKKDFAQYLHEDIAIRKFIAKRLQQAAIPHIDIKRATDKLRIIIYSARPGIIIGRRGSEIDKLKDELSHITDKDIHIDIKEIKNPTCEAQLVSDNIAFQLVKRMPHKRAMKKAISSAMSSGAKGIKISCAGRLGGAEIARTEALKEGSVPLQTLRADIDYGFSEARTTYGQIGVKVWIYKGDILPERKGVRDGDDAKKG